MMTSPLSTPSASRLAYTMLRSMSFALNYLSAQGLVLWVDKDNCWRWRWQGTDHQAISGFGGMGEAVIDAVVTRYPERFQVVS